MCTLVAGFGNVRLYVKNVISYMVSIKKASLQLKT